MFGSGLFTYKDKFFLTLTGRNDWSSTLPSDNNSYFYPSASIAGIALDNGDTFVKLRAAVAKVAKDTDPYFTKNSLTPGRNAANFGEVKFPIGGQMAFELNNVIGNPDLKPEITTEFEIGSEVSLLNRMINLDLTYYNKVSKDVIINRQLARSTGFSEIRGNYIDLKNHGVELAINATPISDSNFKWVVNYTFTKNMNEVTNVVDGLSEIIINSAYTVNFYAEKGEPLGVFKTKVPLLNSAGQVVVDANGIPRESQKEQKIGNSQRDFIMGLQNSFQYKNFRLSFSLDYKQGGEMYSYTARLLGFTGGSVATTYNSRNPFIVPNSVVENTNGSYSENTSAIAYADVTGYYSQSNNGSIEETHVVDKTFIRLQDLSLAYSFPSSITKKLKLNTMSLSIYGKNLFMWTPDDNPYIDPEVSTFGNDLTSEFGEFSGNPTQRTYGMALKISL
jgi:outer membrane receptor protein involved in Fe transport